LVLLLAEVCHRTFCHFKRTVVLQSTRLLHNCWLTRGWTPV